jgi:hypothetical protein
MMVEVPARGNPVAVFFPRPSRAIAAYRDGYAVVELGEKAALRGWRAIRLPEAGAIVRVREGHGWRERYFFPHGARVGEIAPDTVLIEGGASLGAGAIVNVGGLLEIRPEGEFVRWERVERVGVMSVVVASDGLLDAVVRPVRSEQIWYRARPDGGREEWKLPVQGPAELAPGLAVVIQDGQAYAAGWEWNAAHLVAEGVKAAGLSPAGNRMVLLRREGEEWVWDFRRIRGAQVLPGPVIPAFSGESLARLGDDPWQWICRVSPDLRWAVLAAPGWIWIERLPEPAARRGDPGGRVSNPRRILPVPIQ